MQYLEEAFQWLNKPAWCDPAQSRFHRTAYWKRKYEIFNVLTTAQEFCNKLSTAYEEAKEEFEGMGLTSEAASNIEQRLSLLLHEKMVKSLREKYKTPERIKQQDEKQPPVIKEIDLAHESDENRLMYAQVLIQGMDTEYILETLLSCTTYIKNLMWAYKTEKPNIETIRRMFKGFVADFQFTEVFNRAKEDFINKEKPLTFQTEDLTLEEELHILQQMLEKYMVAACQHTKWGKKYQRYLHNNKIDVVELARDVYHADGCEYFLKDVVMKELCQEAIEKKEREIEKRNKKLHKKEELRKAEEQKEELQKKKQEKPSVFNSEEAQPYWGRLIKAGLVDEQHQLAEGLSDNDAAYIAIKFNEVLRPGTKSTSWQYFETLWGKSNFRAAGCTKGEYPKNTGRIDEAFS